LLHDRLTSLDAIMFGHLAPLLKAPLTNSALQTHLKACRNLVSFCHRISTEYFPLSAEGTSCVTVARTFTEQANQQLIYVDKTRSALGTSDKSVPTARDEQNHASPQ